MVHICSAQSGYWSVVVLCEGTIHWTCRISSLRWTEGCWRCCGTSTGSTHWARQVFSL